jgi:hypothetical protein
MWVCTQSEECGGGESEVTVGHEHELLPKRINKIGEFIRGKDVDGR